MAEFIMKDLVAKQGLQDYFHIESAATSAEELGSPVHSGTRNILDSLAIDSSHKRARKISRKDYSNFDMLIGMDTANIRSMQNLMQNDPEHKIYKLLEFAGSTKDLADPWYTHDFETCYRDVAQGCLGLLSFLVKKSPGGFC